jgi:hypothetical protein
MEKIKNAISKAFAWLKQAYQWLSLEGGMLHFLACYACMLTFAPLGLGWASLITWALAIGKEAFDLIRKRNNLRNVANDLIRDALGWACAYVVSSLI